MSIEPKSCQFCGKPSKNVKMHEKYCNMNPKKNSYVVGIGKDTDSYTLPKDSTSAQRNKIYESIARYKFGMPPNEPSLLSRLFRRKEKAIPIEVSSPEDLIVGLKPYQITQSNPKSGLGKLLKKDKDFIQVVLVSEIIEPKTFWAEKTGMNRIQYKDRMYKLPRDIKGNVFFWHIDKKEPLIDSAHADQSDAESSFHELQLFNMAYSVGRAAGSNDLMNNLKLIMLMMIGVFLLIVVTLYYLSTVQNGLNANDEYIINTLNYINQSIPRNY